MTLPQRPAVVGVGSGWRIPVLVLATVTALGAAGLSARAEEPDPFSATVTADATAENAMQAREKARLDGQRRALAAVVEHLSGGTAATSAAAASGKMAKLDDKAITDLVVSFEVANERMSAVRYAADYTFQFRPAEARRALQNAGIALGDAATASGGKPPVLLPVYQADGQSRLWEDPNPWRDAWGQQTRLIVPLGDAADLAAIDADKAHAGDVEALAAVARRNGGDETIVALAAIRGPSEKPTGVEVTARRYRTGRLVGSHVESLTANPGENPDALLRRAVAAVAGGIESGWKKEAVPGYDQLGSLTAILPISSLDDWVNARERLAGVPTIRKVALVALSRQEATIEIGYGGSLDQLKASLAEISLDLVRGDPLWRLARTGAHRTP